VLIKKCIKLDYFLFVGLKAETLFFLLKASSDMHTTKYYWGRENFVENDQKCTWWLATLKKMLEGK